MLMKKIGLKLSLVRSFLSQVTPAIPAIRDSLRLQSSDYDVRHRASKLTFSLKAGSGDYWTFYECCLRQDYFTKGIELQKGDRVLDIGGNFGAFSLMASRKVGPEGSVHCYEPSPDSASRIAAHVRRNDLTNIHLEQRAVGGENGHISLYTHAKSAFSSTFEEIDGRQMGELNAIKIEQVSISDLLEKIPGEIALAKIDCEGSEYDIMETISDHDLSRIRSLIMETHDVSGKSRDAIFEKLRDNNFEIRHGNPFVALNRTAS